jgi:hypothetical protein
MPIDPFNTPSLIAIGYDPAGGSVHVLFRNGAVEKKIRKPLTPEIRNLIELVRIAVTGSLGA